MKRGKRTYRVHVDLVSGENQYVVYLFIESHRVKDRVAGSNKTRYLRREHTLTRYFTSGIVSVLLAGVSFASSLCTLACAVFFQLPSWLTNRRWD